MNYKSLAFIPAINIVAIVLQYLDDNISTDACFICISILVSAFAIILALAKGTEDTEDTEDTEK